MTVGFWVALGSALGGLGRFWCSGLIARAFGETFPWGTLAVNVTGSLLIGLFATVTGPDGRLLLGAPARQFFMLGIFGGFTTFSSFSLQTLALAQDGEWLRASLNIVASVVLCLLGVWIGHALGVAINR
ncbi:MAG: fluoride efflux transporter CrcB [Alphaproteobacteria bacterium]|nr:MAG: fluoride efflux transporter CrcB [Alphaproteobacteria bacterium]